MIKVFFVLLFLFIGLTYSSAQPLAGNILWLKADFGVKDSSGRVITWRDVRDSTKVANCPSEVNRPYLVKNSMNGLPVVRGGGYAQFMDGPAVFPVLHDYSLCYVVQLNNFASANNTIGGNGHTMYYNPLIVNHGNFYYSSYSFLPFILYHPHIVTVVYNQAKQTVRQYLDGDLMDSSYIGSNSDPTLQLGAYQHTNYLIGDLAEFMLYDHEFTLNEQKSAEEYLFTKYAIERPIRAYPPNPIFTDIPQDLQLFPRDAKDSAIVRIAGKISNNQYDSMIVVVEKNNSFWEKLTQKLLYNGSEATFEFLPSIHSELSEFSFRIYGRKSGTDTLLAHRRDIVCGDVFLIQGQSNAIQGRPDAIYRNEYCRTFGMNASYKPSDTLWALSTGITNSGGTNVGAWGLRIQELLIQSYNIPICLMNAGEISTNIERHLPNASYADDRYTLYGRLLYRVEHARLAKAVKALIFYQGESDVDPYYFSLFTTLYDRWNIDYPNTKHIYVLQIHPGCIAGSSQGKLREVQRTFPNFFPKVSVFTTAGIFGHTDCHYTYRGYQIMGEQLFRIIARDFYGANDTIAIESPMIRTARFTDSTKSTLALVFTPKGTRMFVEQSYPFKDVTAHINDAFITDNGDTVTSVSSRSDTVFVQFSAPSKATNISYIRDNYYVGTEIPYEGPWLTNQRSMSACTFYEFPISKIPITGVPPEFENKGQNFDMYPNPARQGIVVQFLLTKPGSVVIGMYDITGKKINDLYVNPNCNIGEQCLYIELPKVTAGTYLIELNSPSGNAVQILGLHP